MARQTLAQLRAENEALRAELGTLRELLERERNSKPVAQPTPARQPEAAKRTYTPDPALVAQREAQRSEWAALQARAREFAAQGRKVRIVGRELFVS